jgi:hypothetical protein
MNIQQVIENTKQLSASDKAFVAHCLISSLDAQSDENVDLAWAELAQERYDELVSGNTESVSWQTIKNNIKS